MKHAQAAAHRSSWSATGSDWRTTEATISVGALWASSNSSSRISRGTGSRPNTLWVRRERTAASNGSVAAESGTTEMRSVGGGPGLAVGLTQYILVIYLDEIWNPPRQPGRS